MKAYTEKLKRWLSSPRSAPVILLIVAALTYGLFFWERGFYWDEAPWTWIYYRLGPAALTKTFSTSRPFWGMIYQVTMPLLGPYPWRWQLLMVILRWLTAVLAWLLLRQVWPRDERPALWGSLLFLVYPGLGQNFIALMYSHFYIVLNCFLFSMYLSVLAIRQPDRRVLLTLGALAFSIVNLLTMEYFYFMEFLRVVLFWIVLDGERSEWKQKLGRVILLFTPYFAVMLGVTFWRLFFFENQNASYGYVTLDLLRENPLLGVTTLLGAVGMAFGETVVHAWTFPFESAGVEEIGWRVTILAAFLVLTSAILIALYLLFFRQSERREQAPVGQIFLLGFTAWLLAGGSFWLVGIEPQLHFSADRFTLPFMLGSSLLLVTVLSLLHSRPRLQYSLLALLIAFSIGKQFETNIAYIRDWDVHQDLFWQLSWRIPSLEPKTAILSNDLPVTYFSDNSLSGPLNWIYSRDGEMDHILYFISIRLNRGLPDLVPGLPIEQNYLAKTFHGDTSQLVVIDYSPPGCLRVLDPQIDYTNRLLLPQLREASGLSNTSLIREDNAVTLPASLFHPEPVHGWCYYFEKAELARQFGHWKEVARLGNLAFQLGEHPDPMERFVFIEGYAHTGDWGRARKLSQESYKVSRNFIGPLLCQLWQRIEFETTDSSEKRATLSEIKNMFACKHE
jgi:hypothetical protein